MTLISTNPLNNEPPTVDSGRRLSDFFDRQSNVQHIHVFSP